MFEYPILKHFHRFYLPVKLYLNLFFSSWSSEKNLCLSPPFHNFHALFHPIQFVIYSDYCTKNSSFKDHQQTFCKIFVSSTILTTRHHSHPTSLAVVFHISSYLKISSIFSRILFFLVWISWWFYISGWIHLSFHYRMLFLCLIFKYDYPWWLRCWSWLMCSHWPLFSTSHSLTLY